jgi:4-amino-4-deoxy-L-arabinose transferase-like glycosyltransferase
MVSASTLAGSIRDRRWSPLLIAALPPLAVAAIVLVNAWPGLMPGVGFWDTGEFQSVLPLLGTAHPTGYPTYVLLGFVANLLLSPIGDPAYRVNAVSLLAVAVAAGTTVLLVRRLTGSMPIAVAAGLGLALTPLVWAYSTRADPHPIHLAFMALLLLALVRWEDARREGLESADRRLLLAAVVFGLAAGNHSLTLLLAPPIALHVLAVEPGIWRRWRFALACLGAAVGTVALVYLELPIRGGLIPPLESTLVYGRPATWDGFWYIALAEQFRGSLGDPFKDLGVKFDDVLALANAQLGPLVLAIPAAFLVVLIRAPRYLLLTGLALVITVLFNEAYSNAEINRYYLGPILWIWTWLAILAAEIAAQAGWLAAELAARLSRARADDRLVERASVGAAIVVAVAIVLPSLGDLDARRKEADRSGDVGAQRWLAEALPVIAPDAVLVSWWSTSTPLWYAQRVEGIRPDIFVVDDRTMLDLGLGRAPDVIRRYLAEGRPVYAIRLQGRDLDELRSQFDMTQVASGGNTGVWAVSGLRAATP